jgi:hypothetical protein
MHWNRCESRGETPLYREEKIVDNVETVCRKYEVFEDYVKIPETGIGDLSDGYHTFNELYHHRAVLFSVICRLFPERAWKSKLHDTGDMFDGMFIVGIETDFGQATYHYDIDPYWDMFEVTELEKAPAYDGHTPTDAIARIATLHMTSSSAAEEPQPEQVPDMPEEEQVSVYEPIYVEGNVTIGEPDGEAGDATPEGEAASES